MKRIMQCIMPLFAIMIGCAGAAEPPADTAGITIKADQLSYDKREDTYHAAGNVMIERQGLTLLADKAALQQKDQTAIAEGNVAVVKENDVLRGDSLRLNLATEQGEMTNADLFIKKENFHLRSDKLQKVGKEDYRLERGSFTTCDGDSPSWKFTASELEVTLEEYATGRNAVFYIKDIPVLYTPYILFPVKRERQSGLLMPRFGNSSLKGVNLDLVYYWAISPSQDATFDLDMMSKRGVGTGVDYRYIFRRGSEGDLRSYFIYDTTESRFRGELAQKHQEIVSPTFSLKSNINLVTDRAFLHDFGEASGDYNRQTLESTATATKAWERALLGVNFDYIIDLTPGSDNDLTLQKLPTASFSWIRQRLGDTPFFISGDAFLDDFYRTRGLKGVRGNVHPTLTFTKTFFSDLETSVWGGYRGRLYYAYDDPTYDGYHDDFLPDAGARVTTSFSRVFSVDAGSLQKIKHVMMPEVSYAYTLNKDQSRLPSFDQNDRIVPQNMVRYGFSSFLTGKFVSGDEPPSYRDLLYLRVSQDYKLSGDRLDLLTQVQTEHPFSDVLVEARTNPLKHLVISGESRYDTYRQGFSSAGVAADLNDDGGNSAGVGYRYARGQVEYMEARLGLSLVKPFVFRYNSRYSFDKRDFLESYYAVEYKHQCWSVIFSYQERPDNKAFLINFTLSGIGSVLPIKAL